MSLISDSASHRREISKTKSIHEQSKSKPSSIGAELRKQSEMKGQKLQSEQLNEQKSYINAQQKFKQMIQANVNNPPLPAPTNQAKNFNNIDNLDKYKVKKNANNSINNQSGSIQKEKISSRGVSPNLHYISKGGQRPKSVLHSRQSSQENISGISGILQTNQSNYLSNNNYNSGGAAQDTSKKNIEKETSVQRRLTLKNYKNERVKKHSNSNQNGSLELRDLKRDESLKKLSELEVQLLSNKNEQFGLQSLLSKNNSYLQLKNLSSNQLASAQKNNSAQKNTSANKNQDLILNIKTDLSVKNNKIDRIADVQSFILDSNLKGSDKNNINSSQTNKSKQSIKYNSKENINIQNKIQQTLLSQQQQQSSNLQLKQSNNNNNHNNIQVLNKPKSYSLYQANNQQTLGFNSFSEGTNNKQINLNRDNSNLTKDIQLLKGSSNNQNSKQLLQPKQENYQVSQRAKDEQTNQLQQKLKNKQLIERQNTEEDKQQQKSQQQIKKSPIQSNNNSTININSQSSGNKNNIFSQGSNNQYPPSIQNIPPVFMGVNANKNLQSSNQQNSLKKSSNTNINNSSNKNYYYNEKYLSDSQRKKENSILDKSPSVISSSGIAIVPINSGLGYASYSSKSVTPDPASRNRSKLDSNRNSMHMIRNTDVQANINKQDSIFKINNIKSNNNSSYNSNSNILPTNINNDYNSNNKSSERLLYHPSSAAINGVQKGDLSKKNSNSFLRKSVNSGLPLVQQDQSITRQNSKSLYIAKPKTERQRSIELGQAQENVLPLKRINHTLIEAQESIEQPQNPQENEQPHLQKNQSSLSELRLRRIRKVNASNSRVILPNMSLNHQQNTEPSDNERKIKQIKRVAKPKIIDDKSGQLKEQTKKRIQQIIEQQNKNKKLFGYNPSIIQQEEKKIDENDLQYSKGEMVTDELRDFNEILPYNGNQDQEKEIKGYIKGLMDVLKNISSAKKINNIPSLKSSPVRKIKMKKRDSISILSSLNQSLLNSANSSLERRKQGNEPFSNKKLYNKLSASKQSEQYKIENKGISEKEGYDSFIKGKFSERKQTPSNIQKQLDYEMPKQQIQQQKIIEQNSSPIGKKFEDENDLYSRVKKIDYQHLIQNSVSKREYNPQNYNYPEPINQEVKEMSVKKMQQSSISHFQNSIKRDSQKKQFYNEDSSPIKTISNGNGSQKLSLKDLKIEQQNNSGKYQDVPAPKPAISYPQAAECSSNSNYFAESIPEKSPIPYLQKSVDNVTARGGYFQSQTKDQYLPPSTSNTEKRSASTHRILGRERPVGEIRSMRLNTSSKERSATIHHGGEEIQGDTDEGEQLGVFCTESKREVLLKVRRGRSVIKTINPYKSAEKISSQLRKSSDKSSNQKLGLSQNRCTSEPRGVMHGRLPSASIISGGNQEDGYIQNNQGNYQIPQSYTARQHRTVSVPNYQYFQPNKLINYSDLREQDQEESKQEVYQQIPLVPRQSNNDSIQQNQLLPIKKESMLSFGAQEKPINTQEKENVGRQGSEDRSTHQKKWIEQISSNLSEQQQDKFLSNLNQAELQHNPIGVKSKQSQGQYYSNQKIMINEMQHQKLIGSSQYPSPYISILSGVNNGGQQIKDAELTELVELLEDDQLDQQTWKKKSPKKFVPAIHFTPSKRNVTNQSHKTAYCSFIDGNETVRTEQIGINNQSQLIFQDENEHEVSQITPKHLNNFKSRNSFLSSDIMSDLNLRRSNQYLQGQPKNQQLLNPSVLINQSQLLQQQQLLPNYQPSPLRPQKDLLFQNQQQLENLISRQQQGVSSRSNSLHGQQTNKERMPISVAINQQSDNNQDINYQGYDYNPEYELQKNNQFEPHLGNQLSYRSRGYFRKPPTHRSYKSRGTIDEITGNEINPNKISVNQPGNKNIYSNQQEEYMKHQQLLSYQIEQQQQLQQQQILSRKQAVRDIGGYGHQQQRTPSYDNSTQQRKEIQVQSQKFNNIPSPQEYNPSAYQVPINKEIEARNEERILDLLLLDTHELKDKLRDQPTRNKYKNEINSSNYKDIVKSLPIPPELPPNKNIFQEYNQKIFSYDRNLV